MASARHAALQPVYTVVRDNSAESADALVLGSRLAALQGVPFVILTVLAASRPPARAGVRARRLELEQTRAWAHVVLPGLDFGCFAVTGPSARQEVHALAREGRAQLLVVPSEAQTSPGRVHLGRWEASSVVHDSPCPVAVAPNGYAALARTPTRFGVAYDGQPESLAALHSAHALASAAGVPLRVIAVPAEEDALAEPLAALGNDVELELVVAPGHPVARLTLESAALDLLVCGSRDRRPLRRLVLGRTPLALMQSAACPVVVVPPGLPLPAAVRLHV